MTSSSCRHVDLPVSITAGPQGNEHRRSLALMPANGRYFATDSVIPTTCAAFGIRRASMQHWCDSVTSPLIILPQPFSLQDC